MIDECRVHIDRTALFVSDVFYVGTYKKNILLSVDRIIFE